MTKRTTTFGWNPKFLGRPHLKTPWVMLMVILAFVGLGTTFNSCSDDDPIEVESGLSITGVSIPSTLDIASGGDVTISGKGFRVGDQISLTSSSDATKVYSAAVKSVTEQTATFSLPGAISSGSYKITVSRGTDSLLLGSFMLNLVANTNIPDKAGMTVKGVVYCDGAGIPDVVVSDGYELTKTDQNGVYYLPSQKKNGYVFISVPGNYEVPANNNFPQFFKKLAGGSTVEQKDFSLIRADNSKHVVLTLADWHLANRNDDLAQFSQGFLNDVNAIISAYQASGTKVYGLTLGDMTWDVYWYDNNFALNQYLTQMNKINCTVFNLMGNHDNDPYYAGDWFAENTYKNIIGPTYYSFNLGNVHYVVLDNVEYINTGGSQGVLGQRNYNDVVVADQMAWLQKDLATITDKSTPIVIGMHTPLYRNPTLDANGNQVNGFALNNGSALATLLQDFSNVHVLSGHTHINYSVEGSQSLMEHNTAAVCATWWWTGRTGYAGNHICKDGSPGGYGIWEINDRDMKWYYKSIGYEKNYQFRSYDLNTVYITAATYAPNSTDAALAPYAGVYASPNSNNEVLINVWGYDSQWKVEVKEGANPLTVTRVSALDPLHIISYEAKRLNVGAVPTDSFVTGATAHMFKVTASSPNSTLEIKVTDRFGNVYTETMTRPKPFTYLMK
ncbi:calcineurin-like phosphoesterase C-terminal domain-containing protein [Gaoshiqia sp. Z1-71]|uniref:calcineurin-like phosphoesterase C-terminal domain-containing protein n=1 Tax=Gaoshiqia hydrogeniformans TaxID=3290090 RepID=UPI003BF82BB7